MKLINIPELFNTEDRCLAYIEKMRWPKGIACVHCGVMNISTITRYSEGDNKRIRIFQCREKACGKQFSATSGTIFNDTHLPLVKWFMAIALICEAKKGISAKQVQRHLGVNYRTAWHLCHRIREAMKEGGLLNGVVESDETYLSRRKARKGNPRVKKQNTDVVLGMIERGGKLRLIPMQDAKMASIEPQIKKHISPDATLQTDEGTVYAIIGKRNFPGRHRTINHIRSYAQGENHTNSIENAFSLLKRGVYGTYHKVSIKHLGRYCNEFSYRFNRRKEQESMFGATMGELVRTKALPYKKLISSPVSE